MFPPALRSQTCISSLTCRLYVKVREGCCTGLGRETGRDPSFGVLRLRRYLVNLSSKMVRTCIVMLVAVIFTGPAIDALKLRDKTYNIPILDPLRITEIKIEDTSTDSTGIDITFNDLDIYGLSEANIVKTNFDLNNKKINIDLTVATLIIKSKYVIDGKILILPIKGNGDCSLNLTNADLKVNLDYELVNKGDKEHMSVTGSKLDFHLGKLDIYLDNLFNGDKALGDNTNKFLNENWEVLAKDLGPFVAEGISAAIKQIAAGLMDKIPYEDLFPVSV
uniref:Uncharacterized protein n=1 Tax=Timema monikensis TaxID=170555 RepID=A0A7R9EDY5_9NEOP|nr:unnamed protein product [Timema monikensis]